jgi:hypothetical protein
VAVAAYAHVAQRLYDAIGSVTGARVVVDSSKVPSYAALLGLMSGIDPYVVHLVRDPRAVAYSWRRRSRDGRSPIDSTLHWVLWNLATARVCRRSGASNSILVRYEDFAARPQEVMADVVRMVGGEPDRLPFVDEHTALLAANHTVSGNRSRFVTGAVRVQMDQAWLGRFRGPGRMASTAISLPLLGRFGYPIRASGGSERVQAGPAG